MVLVGPVCGITLFVEVGVVLLIPLVFSIARKTSDFNDLYHETGDSNAVYERGIISPATTQRIPIRTFFNVFDLPYIDDEKSARRINAPFVLLLVLP